MKEAHGSGILLPGDGQEHVRVTPEGSLIIGEKRIASILLLSFSSGFPVPKPKAETQAVIKFSGWNF